MAANVAAVVRTAVSDNKDKYPISMQTRHWNIAIGLLFAALSLVTLLWWIPNDIETGVIYVERRDIEVGDAMAPTMAAIAVLVFSLALMLTSILGGSKSGVGEPMIGVSKSNLANILVIALLLIVPLAMMVWAGPLLVQAMQSAGSDIKSYRLLSATVPYKYTGFAIGGFCLVTGLISWIEGRISWPAVATGICAVLALIAVYDIPFDTLLLPPNGEQ